MRYFYYYFFFIPTISLNNTVIQSILVNTVSAETAFEIIDVGTISPNQLPADS